MKILRVCVVYEKLELLVECIGILS